MTQPYRYKDATASSPYVIICDHGGNTLPNNVDLGLSNIDRMRHISYDIGAYDIATLLAKNLQCAMIASNYSRLYIDFNRPLDDVTSIRSISDGTIIHGNKYLSDGDIAERHRDFTQYHDKISTMLQDDSVLISVHSFTPYMRDNQPRPWHIGILSHQYRGLSDIFIKTFMHLYPNDMVGDNLPYSGMDDYSYSIMRYGIIPKRPYIVIELRQDLIADEQGQHIWADKILQTLQHMA